MTEDKKRREPSPVAPVTANGIRYEAPLSGAPYGFQQDGGVVTARDSQSNALLWVRKIYGIASDDGMESDKQDVFITSLTLTPDKSALLIENEAGERFTLSLSALAVEKANN